jgi:hypothetical protein
LALEKDLTMLDFARRLRDEPHHRQCVDRFAGAGFADDTERRTGIHRVRQPVDRADQAVVRLERGPQVLDLEQRQGD